MSLALQYVPSDKNPADMPSRSLSKSDATLSRRSWLIVDQLFGGMSGHTLDLMALDSNAMEDYYLYSSFGH